MTPDEPRRVLVEGGAITPGGLDAPAPAGVAALARDRLDQLRDARLRLADPADGEALHDFRVALRRLRSLLRAYRPVVGDAVSPRVRRRVRGLARITNPSRDLEVKLRWLAGAGADLRPRDQVGHRWFVRYLTTAKQDADARAARRIARRFEAVTGALDEALTALAHGASPGGPTLAAVTGERLALLAGRLERRLARVRTIADQRPAHAARIAGKRVRYLLEPLAGAMPEAAAGVEAFKAFQDLSGDMHDADVLANSIAAALEAAAAERGQRVADRIREGSTLDRAALRRERRRDPSPGLLALADRARAAREHAWTALERDWLARPDRLLEPVAQVAAALARRPRPGLEIERKFLLTGVPPRAREAPALELDQGYLPGERIQERVRRVRRPDGTERWLRTLKAGLGLVREEVEEETSREVFEALWPLTQGRRVRKRRYRVEENGLAWEVDEFTDRELALAEVELASVDQDAPLPAWLAPYVAREVTDDPAYLNASLAR